MRDVRQLMSNPVTVIGPEERVNYARELMIELAVHHLPVVDNGELIGMLSATDLNCRARRDSSADARVRSVMSSPVEIANSVDDVGGVVARMIARGIHAMPVMDAGKLVGIVTSSDVIARDLAPVDGARKWTADQIMTRSPVCLRPDDALSEAVVVMLGANIRHLPVVDDEQRVVGMLSDRDVRTMFGELEKLFARDDYEPAPTDKVKDVMTPNPITVTRDTTVVQVATCLATTRFGAVPVVDEAAKLVGIVSYVDLLEEMAVDGSVTLWLERHGGSRPAGHRR